MSTLIPKFQQTGTGAVNRPINLKLAESISVLDFGATGDGITDDSLALENARLAAQTQNKALYLPGGTYCFSEATLGNPAGFGWYFSADGLEMYGDGDRKTMLKNISATGAGVRCAGGFLNFHDFGIDNNSSTGIAFQYNGQYSIARHINISNQSGTSYALVCNGGSLIRFEYITTENCINGFSLGASSPTQYITFTGCVIEWGTAGIGLNIGTATGIKFNNLYLEPKNGTATNAGLINITSGIDIGFYGLNCEVFGALSNASQAWVYVENSKNVNFYGGRVFDSVSNSASTIYFKSGAGCNGLSFNGLELQSTSATMTMFSIGTGTNINIENTTTNNTSAATGVTSAVPTGISICNWADVNFPCSHVLEAVQLFVQNVAGNIAIGNRENTTLINCTGALSGTGVSNVTLLDNLIISAAEGSTRPKSDNVQSLGSAGNRWTTVYATTGAINTSDGNLKQAIKTLDEKELAVARVIKGLVKTFKFKDAVLAKGDSARIHIGVIAQEVQAAFESEGLDANSYSLFCSDVLENGTVQLGVRYDELLAFIIAGL